MSAVREGKPLDYCQVKYITSTVIGKGKMLFGSKNLLSVAEEALFISVLLTAH
jgi:hypothetical protein